MYVNLILKYCKSVDVFIARKIFATPKHTTCKDNSNTRILSYVNVHYWGPKNCKKRKRFMILTRSRRDERDLVEIYEISKNSARFCNVSEIVARKTIFRRDLANNSARLKGREIISDAYNASKTATLHAKNREKLPHGIMERLHNPPFCTHYNLATI